MYLIKKQQNICNISLLKFSNANFEQLIGSQNMNKLRRIEDLQNYIAKFLEYELLHLYNKLNLLLSRQLDDRN